jgi:hypothetical protein
VQFSISSLFVFFDARNDYAPVLLFPHRSNYPRRFFCIGISRLNGRRRREIELFLNIAG